MTLRDVYCIVGVKAPTGFVLQMLYDYDHIYCEKAYDSYAEAVPCFIRNKIREQRKTADQKDKTDQKESKTDQKPGNVDRDDEIARDFADRHKIESLNLSILYQPCCFYRRDQDAIIGVKIGCVNLTDFGHDSIFKKDAVKSIPMVAISRAYKSMRVIVDCPLFATNNIHKKDIQMYIHPTDCDSCS